MAQNDNTDVLVAVFGQRVELSEKLARIGRASMTSSPFGLYALMMVT